MLIEVGRMLVRLSGLTMTWFRVSLSPTLWLDSITHTIVPMCAMFGMPLPRMCLTFRDSAMLESE